MSASLKPIGRLSQLIFIAAVILALAQSVLAQKTDADHQIMSVERLKIVYLDCARQATLHRQDTGDVMYCSIIYEELKRRGFNRDFNRMRAWEHAQR